MNQLALPNPSAPRSVPERMYCANTRASTEVSQLPFDWPAAELTVASVMARTAGKPANFLICMFLNIRSDSGYDDLGFALAVHTDPATLPILSPLKRTFHLTGESGVPPCINDYDPVA